MMFDFKSIMVATLCASVTIAANAKEGPCDIYAKAGTPCVAAHSTTRALFGDYDGALYQVRRADGQLKDIPVEKAGGYANTALQDQFCAGSSCTISILYDQSSYKNDLVKSPVVFWLKNGGKEAVANKAPIYMNGHKVYGIYRDAWSSIGYRNNKTKGVATGDQEEAMYMVVDGRHYNDKCCYNYGNVETTGNDDGPGTMEAVYFGSDVEWGGYGQGKGPWVAADLEDGVFKGDDAGYLWGKTHTTPWTTAYSFVADFVTAMLKGPNDGTFKLKGADAQQEKLTTVWDGKRKRGYSPRKLQGAIVLGNGGDGSDGGAGTFFEGVMTIGCPPDSIDDKVQKNIAAAGYGRKEAPADPIPPTVSFTGKYADSVTVGEKVAVAVSASDEDGSVSHIDFFDNDSLIHSEWNAPYEFDWAIATEGTHKLVAVVYDDENLTASDTLSVTAKPAQIIGIAERKMGSFNLVVTPMKFQVFNLQGMLVAEIESTAADLQNQLKSEKLHKGVYIAKPANARIGLFKVKI